MKSRKLKVILAAVMALLLVCVPLTALAAEDEEITVTEEALPETETNGDGEAAVTDAEQNIFAKAYEAVLSHSGELLSALAFIGTLIIGYAYKKGLLPIVTRTLSSLSSSVGRIKEDTERLGESSDVRLGELSERLGLLEQALTRVREGTDGLSSELSRLEGKESERESMRVIMSAQVDMLYDIFMSSAIPEYQKEAVGARINAMRQRLEAAQTNEE